MSGYGTSERDSISAKGINLIFLISTASRQAQVAATGLKLYKANETSPSTAHD
jgi:hypothetical protein